MYLNVIHWFTVRFIATAAFAVQDLVMSSQGVQPGQYRAAAKRRASLPGSCVHHCALCISLHFGAWDRLVWGMACISLVTLSMRTLDNHNIQYCNLQYPHGPWVNLANPSIASLCIVSLSPTRLAHVSESETNLGAQWSSYDLHCSKRLTLYIDVQQKICDLLRQICTNLNPASYSHCFIMLCHHLVYDACRCTVFHC